MGKPIKMQLAKMWLPRPTLATVFKYMPFMYNHFNFVEAPQPDYVLYSTYKTHDTRGVVSPMPPGNYTKIFYNPEMHPFDMKDCDWALSGMYEDEINHPRYIRLPFYKFLGAGKNLIKGKINGENILKRKTKFCAFIYSNSVPFRNKFFHKLSKYKRIDSPGRVLNNMPIIGRNKYKNALDSRLSAHWIEEKIRFIDRYKFIIAFENKALSGYTCEKLYHTMLVNSIPIHWGNPRIAEDFNVNSFINIRTGKDFDRAIDQIVQLDRNDDLYIKKLQQPWYPNNQLTKYARNDRYINWFKTVFNT
jgi:hypothetical protein